MELQLGLGLPSNPIKEFDLNSHYEAKEMVGSEKKWSQGFCFSNNNMKNKRSFDDAFEKTIGVTETLPLLLWNDQPDEEDDRKGFEKCSSYTITEDDHGDRDYVVGWPPIKSWRKKLQFQNQGGNGGSPNSKYVKVKMEGVGIGRKVDLSLHCSYQTLTDTLISMFGKYRGSVRETKDGTRYSLTYQDKEGDWLLAGDVPWQTFIKSVKLLKIQKNGG
ncbi:hypothetical protein HHK36_006268 [Tetracentron sinense]|uniref:Auxin-responsive protein n=1 Tax=Tetracentron sinense TaxID=13715 RepID=A0A834ZIK0_TETSI|nr:hypothetical protein HHK36_006268 [Tetracentron sinense]